MSQEELQKKYIELKFLEQQASQIQQQLIFLENQKSILEKTKECIDDVKNIKKDSQALIPLGQGVFAKGLIQDTTNLLIGVGHNVVVSKPAKEAKIIIDKQLSEIANMISLLSSQLQQTAVYAGLLEEELQALSSNRE